MASKIILEHLKRWEGLRLTAYPDPGSRDGQPFTIGYGHTSDAVMHVSEGMTISKAEAEAVLLHDAEQAAAIVDRFVLVPLNENQRAALVSFVFNVGGAAFTASTLLRKLNAGDYDAVPRVNWRGGFITMASVWQVSLIAAPLRLAYGRLARSLLRPMSPQAFRLFAIRLRGVCLISPCRSSSGGSRLGRSDGRFRNFGCRAFGPRG